MRHGNRLGLTEPFLCTLVDVLVAQMGDAYPELQVRPRLRRPRSSRSEEERFEAVLTDRSAAPRGTARRVGRGRRPPRRRRVPAVRLVRPADGLHRGHGSAARHRARPRGLRAGHEGAASARPGQQRVRQDAPGGVLRAERRHAPGARAGRRPVRGLHRDSRWRACPCVALFDGSGQDVAVAGRRRRPATWRSPGRRSTSSPAARCPTRGACSPKPAASPPPVDGVVEGAPAGRGCTSVHVEQGTLTGRATW